jgi:hypothetical protein
MNMKAAALMTANLLQCPHAECPRAVLCSEHCVERRKRDDPQHHPRPQNPKQPPTGATTSPELFTDDLIDA